MSLKVTGHFPSINATGVFRNETIKVYFDKPLQPNTITWDTISVQDKSTFSTVVGSLGAIWTSSGAVLEADFVPSLNLVANNEYSVYIFGEPTSIIAVDGSQLPETYSFSFTTGTGYYDASGNIGVPSGYDSDDTNYTSLYGLDISGLFIRKTAPYIYQPDVPTNSGQINIYFNIPILEESLSGYFSVEVKDVLE